MKTFHDASRAVLRVTGADARDLLQDLVTNDLGRLAPDRPVYAALLTPQGKYLFDFFIVEAEDALLLDVAAERAAALAQRLTLYRLRRKMAIEAADLSVTLVWDAPAPPPGGLADPRDARLGWRLYGAAPAETNATRADYDALRVAVAAPEAGAELIPDESYILEMGFERLHGVDFRKGCYVGQEVTARMKHKTTLRKGLARVRVGAGAEAGAEIMAGDRPAGRLHTVAGDQGLAYLRFDRATGEMTAGGAAVELLDRPEAG